ncbi:MAG: Ni/Fe-hydrogenase cytochrome b subunit [Deltaproteobacteria bacterium]|nr:Ni/Fe-hydrogenase cytochrome b subunit [Deltaproteobacteria bacterium]
MSHQEHAAPVENKFFTPGMKILTAVMLTGLGFGLYRMIFGLEAATHLNDQYPLGLWIGVDVATGVALAAGGFTSGALVYVFQREHFHAVIRPALLTAMLGYTFVGVGLMFDLGRWYNIWHPAIPFMWQGNSVLFEVGMCVMIYINVLYLEFAPIVCERFIGRVNLPVSIFPLNLLNQISSIVLRGSQKQIGEHPLNYLIDMLLRFADHILGKIMFVFILAGIVLSCCHQSSLGTLMVIAPYKMHPLYSSQLGPLFFLTSAFAVGLTMIVFESMIASHIFGRKPEMHILTPLSKIIPWLLGFYISIKLGDMLYRETYHFLFEGSAPVIMFWIEFGLLTVVPCCMLLSQDVRRSPRGLFIATAMYIAGICLNRCTVFMIAYKPLYAQKAYIPALSEFALTIGLIATIVFIYRLVVTVLPVLPMPETEKKQH